jgi:hypothetical protein
VSFGCHIFLVCWLALHYPRYCLWMSLYLYNQSTSLIVYHFNWVIFNINIYWLTYQELVLLVDCSYCQDLKPGRGNPKKVANPKIPLTIEMRLFPACEKATATKDLTHSAVYLYRSTQKAPASGHSSFLIKNGRHFRGMNQKWSITNFGPPPAIINQKITVPIVQEMLGIETISNLRGFMTWGLPLPHYKRILQPTQVSGRCSIFQGGMLHEHRSRLGSIGTATTAFTLTHRYLSSLRQKQWTWRGWLSNRAKCVYYMLYSFLNLFIHLCI